MPGMVMAKAPEKHWVRYIKQRVRQNKNALLFISGPTGSGKSYSCLRIAEELDPDFNIDRVVFSTLELMELINSGTLKKGSVIVNEELGVSASHKNWMSQINKCLGFLTQTFRHRCFVLLMNSPYMDFVDATVRKLFHGELKTMSIDFKSNEVRLKPHLMQYNSRMRKFYYRYLQVITKEGTYPVTVWRVAKPSDKLLKEYEKKKTKFTTELNLKIIEELKKQDKKKKKLKCVHCGYTWTPRSADPKLCPRCKQNPF